MQSSASRCLILAAIAVAGGAQQPFPERARPMPPEIVFPEAFRDVAALDPAHYTVEFENQRVRVLRLKLKGDESVPRHDDRAGLVVCMSECHIRFKRPDGKLQDLHMQAGETRWVWDDTRSETNLSPQPLELLYIEMKPNSG